MSPLYYKRPTKSLYAEKPCTKIEYEYIYIFDLHELQTLKNFNPQHCLQSLLNHFYGQQPETNIHFSNIAFVQKLCQV